VKEYTRILAIDPGKARLGLAISDAERRIASPLATWTRRDLAQDGHYLKQVVEDEEVGLIVVGLPVHLNGREGEQAKAARKLGAWVAELTGVRCVLVDERFTTREAESHLWDAGLSHKRRKERRDQVAAQILLQSYLEAGCPAETAALPMDDPPLPSPR
jgi:putative holliday junction resolvase